MAIGLRMRIDGGTQEMYETINATVGVEEDPPEGLIFHAAGPIEGGWGIIDFWETREHFDRFQESRLGPAMGSLDNSPQGGADIKEFPVHNIFKP